MRDTGVEISEALKERPLRALELYESAPASEELRGRFGDTIQLLGAARATDLDALSQVHARARREDRRRIRAATIDRFFQLANDRAALRRIGARLPRLVLEGALQQQFCCRLAADFGLRPDIPPPLRDELMVPLIDALRTVLRVGAPATRDAAIEGLGALLKHFPDPAAALPADAPLPVAREHNESDEDYEARRKVSEEYFDRLHRRRLMALTVAGHDPSRKEFGEKLAAPMAKVIARLRAGPDAAEEIAFALWERSDLLRILPAVARQRRGAPLPQKPSDLLIAAAEPLALAEDDPPEVAIAVARYRESVFRTIDAWLRRGAKWKKFDDVMAGAVSAIPHTVAGSPAMCNAEIRATVAAVRTAVRLLRISGENPSSTEAALATLFATLEREPTPWANHGIAEGCFRELPDLLAHPRYTEMTRPALRALFEQLKHVPAPDDLVEVHRRLIANSCFRRIALSLTDHLQERLLFEPEVAARLDREQVHRNVRVLLRYPNADKLRQVCQHPEALAAEPVPSDVAEPVIAGIALESDLLRRSTALFACWEDLSTIDKVLLARILGAQLHAISRDLPQLRRHDVLRRVFAATPGVSLGDEEAMHLTWTLLSSLPAEAADAADMEIQRFVEYRGRRSGSSERQRTAVEDLPGYVLAMISPVASSRIAGTIAREIDLNLRYERGQPHADCAKSLYQVMLRGPHESIFDHLLPRLVDPAERAVVMLFRRHVANVRRSSRHERKFDLDQILDHVTKLLRDLEHSKSKVLCDLRDALTLYRDLASRSEEVWKRIAGGEAVKLFQLFDTLAAETDYAQQGLRKPLLESYERRLTSLQDDVAHYVTLPVGNFSARAGALAKASDIAAELELALDKQAGLQPPERILLVALMQHLDGLFRATIRWYCDEPRRRIEEKAEHEKAKDEFWLFFCDPGSPSARLESLAALVRGGPEDADIITQLAHADHVARFKRLIGDEPPPFPKQREKFEEFFVEWRAADLDVDTLKERLARRWPPWFRGIYSIVTSFWWMCAIIAAICIWAAVAHSRGWHGSEGLGFFLVSALSLTAAVLALTQFVHKLAQFFAGRSSEEQKRGYWFQSLLPRLVRLTVVPMALIVEFDHSYEFPQCGSTSVLLLLMILSFLTTKFFVTREIVDQSEHPGEVKVTKSERKRVWQIVALALAHSFGIAVLLAAIFASSHAKGRGCHHGAAPAHPPSPPHEYDTFLGVIPRDVPFDLSHASWLPSMLAEHAKFTFYPTIILTWTALGLFFGVFLEGFMKGERLRGRTEREEP